MLHTVFIIIFVQYKLYQIILFDKVCNEDELVQDELTTREHVIHQNNLIMQWED